MMNPNLAFIFLFSVHLTGLLQTSLSDILGLGPRVTKQQLLSYFMFMYLHFFRAESWLCGRWDDVWAPCLLNTESLVLVGLETHTDMLWYIAIRITGYHTYTKQQQYYTTICVQYCCSTAKVNWPWRTLVQIAFIYFKKSQTEWELKKTNLVQSH